MTKLTLIIALSLASITCGCGVAVAQNPMCTNSAQTIVSDLQQLAGTGTNVERAVVLQDNDTFQTYQGVYNQAPFNYDSHSVLVLHNHPYKDVMPSAHDIAVAKKIGIPIYVVTRTAVWVAMPNGSVQQSDTFKNLTLYTQDAEGAPLYGRQHFSSVKNVMSQCVETHLSTMVFLKSAQ